MVRHYYLLTLILLFAFADINAAPFTASVSHNEVGYKQKFKFLLKLSNETPTKPVDISAIKKDFRVLSSSNNNSTKIINGNITSTHEWTYILQPKKQGVIDIKPVSIETGNGIFYSNSVNIKVLDSATTKSNPKETKIFTKTVASNYKPYVHEPILYKVQFYTQTGVNDVHFDKIKVDDAIVESAGDYRVQDKVINSLKYKMVEWQFYITPLKAGTISIPEITLNGKFSTPNQQGSSFFTSSLINDSGFFDDDYSNEFSISASNIKIEALPAENSVNPWLPAKLISLKDQWTRKKLQAGEPITRKIIIKAQGVLPGHIAKQLMESSDGNFKVYSDDAKLDLHIEGNTPIAKKEETFTIVPQRSGKIVIPEIRVDYWDTHEKKKKTAKLESITFDVAVAPEDLNSDISSDKKTQDDTPKHGRELNKPNESPDSKSNNILVYLLVLALLLLSSFMLLKLLKLQNALKKAKYYKNKIKIDKSVQESSNEVYTITRDTGLVDKHKTPNVSDKINLDLKDIKQIDSVHEAQDALSNYCYSYWNFPKNLSALSIVQQVKKSHPDFNDSKSFELGKQIEALLYSNKKPDIKKLSSLIDNFIKELEHLRKATTQDKQTKKKKTLPKLNPL